MSHPDLLFALLVMALGGVSLAIGGSTLAVAAGFPLYLIVTGYLALAALAPSSADLANLLGPRMGGWSTRLILSLAASVVIAPLIALVLAILLPAGLTRVSFLVSLLTVDLALLLTAYLRRREALTWPDVRGPFQSREPGRWAAALVVIAALGSFAVMAFVALSGPPPAEFTEFAVLGSGGLAQDYPSQLRPGETANVTLQIANHEGKSVAYAFRAAWERENASSPVAASTVTLDDGAATEFPLEFQAPETPGAYVLVLELTEPSSQRTQRLSLHIRVTP